jgi:hypothetical protein
MPYPNGYEEFVSIRVRYWSLRGYLTHEVIYSGRIHGRIIMITMVHFTIAISDFSSNGYFMERGTRVHSAESGQAKDATIGVHQDATIGAPQSACT